MAAGAEESAPQAGLRVLLVDDDPLQLEMTAAMCRRAGRDLCGAAGTEENVSQRFGTLRHTAYRQCLSGHLPRL